MSKKVEQMIETLVKPVVETLGYELADVEFAKEGTQWVLTLFISKPEGITVEDCERVSIAIDPIIDEADPIEQAYFLSVSSLGLDRPLKKDRDFERSIGKEITAHLFAPIDKKKEFTGVLVSFNEDSIAVEISGKQVVLPRKAVSIVKPYIKF